MLTVLRIDNEFISSDSDWDLLIAVCTGELLVRTSGSIVVYCQFHYWNLQHCQV